MQGRSDRSTWRPDHKGNAESESQTGRGQRDDSRRGRGNPPRASRSDFGGRAASSGGGRSHSVRPQHNAAFSSHPSNQQPPAPGHSQSHHQAPGRYQSYQQPSAYSAAASRSRPPVQHSPSSTSAVHRSHCSPQSSCTGSMCELTVQLTLDLSSIMLLEPDSCRRHAAFEGHAPPGHHDYTALHDYLEAICPSVGGSFADVWLDTAHVTFATLQLPRQNLTKMLAKFKAIFVQRAVHLPCLSQGCYIITALALQKKAHRREKNIKGDSFYYLDLEAATADFTGIQALWLEALRETAHDCGGSTSDHRDMQRQHMTIRSFSLKTVGQSFDQLKEAVQLNPATMQCSGIRIQQSVDDAIDPQTGTGIIAHGYLHSPMVRYPRPVFSSCSPASHGISIADRRRRLQSAGRKLQQGLANHLGNMQLTFEAADNGGATQQ